MLLSTIIDLAPGTILRDGEFENLGFVSEGQNKMLTFVEHARFLGQLRKNSSVCAVLTTPELAANIPRTLALAVCEHPRLGFALIHNYLSTTGFYWEDFKTVIDDEAKLHSTAWVAEKNVRIGPNSTVGPRATILERCTLGHSCTVGAGSVLGGVGLQTVRSGETLIEMQHAGSLLLGDRVHVLPGAVIATGLFRQDTVIHSDARIGSLAFVSHGVVVGRAAFVGHGAVLNGHVTVGDRVWVGPGAVVAQNLEISDDAIVSLGAVVIRKVKAGARVSGNFAVSHRSLLRNLAVISPGE